MAISWPLALQQKLNSANFRIQKGSVKLESEMDIGPVKSRARFTKSVDTFSCSIWVDASDFTTFENFYDTTLGGGTKVFEFNHPITGTLTNFKFLGTPNYSPVNGGIIYEVSMTWEKQP